MGANLNRVLIVDIEATCWSTPEEQGSQPNEVIEIGMCALNLKTNAIEDARSYAVRPRFSNVSEFCTELTGWTQAQVDAAPPVEEVLRRIQDDYGITRHLVWFSCGEYDRVKLASTGPASLHGLYGVRPEDNPFALMRAHYNIKTLFALKHRLAREMGMARMLSHIGETLDGRHHSGVDDAINIAKLVRHLLT